MESCYERSSPDFRQNLDAADEQMCASCRSVLRLRTTVGSEPAATDFQTERLTYSPFVHAARSDDGDRKADSPIRCQCQVATRYWDHSAEHGCGRKVSAGIARQ